MNIKRYKSVGFMNFHTVNSSVLVANFGIEIFWRFAAMIFYIRTFRTELDFAYLIMISILMKFMRHFLFTLEMRQLMEISLSFSFG